ncbi:MAG: YlbF family regulator [Alicyclobacillus herbarius]|uniref:YlbF family regulator n=1 Tax=Alicyclobacillus herbarius TaxID=122960 RepID=UPI002356B46C|nr:YlbF family regulator [Alicyclobacillus herbarius]MCL6631723.1 YlbF family regulator [Alicyclobacillus herbarius]
MDRNELWAQAEELADLILQTEEIQRYQAAEAKLQQHSEAQALIRRLRSVQEQIEEFAARKVPEAYYRHLTQESESLLEQLEKIPVVREFQEAQTAVNNLLQDVSEHLGRVVQERITED